MPLPSEGGHVRTSDFKINLEGDYSIDLATATPAKECDEEPPAPWSISKNGSTLATGEGKSSTGFLWPERGCAIGGFHAAPGAYRLNLDIAKGPNIIVVYENGGRFLDSTPQGAHALTACVILIPIVLVTLVIGAIRQHEERRAAADSRWTLAPLGPLFGAHSRVRRSKSLHVVDQGRSGPGLFRPPAGSI